MTKRLFDLCISFVGLVLLTPIFLLVTLWIKLDSSGEVFFRQERVGLRGKMFSIHKFRTMCTDAEIRGRLTIGDDSRITSSGRFLRKYKVDELPQLFDVLLGNMSLVGPRPEVQEFIDAYPDDIRERILSVRPGITDMASIKMIDENDILAKEKDPKQAYIDIILPLKQQYYLDYVNQQGGVWLDLKIILLTLKKIITR